MQVASAAKHGTPGKNPDASGPSGKTGDRFRLGCGVALFFLEAPTRGGAGDAMVAGVWLHQPWVIALGLAVILAAWANGLVHDGARKS